MRKKHLVVLILLLGVIFVGGLLYARFRNGRVTLPPAYYRQPTTQSAQPILALDHVVIIVDENKTDGAIIGSPLAPFINRLAQTFSVTTNYYAVTNPSLPNYLALTSGSTNGFTSDCTPPSTSCQANVANIADRLEQAKRTWKEYAESMPAACSKYNSGNYAVKHNPFMYYPDITDNKGRCVTHVVPFTELATDLTSVTTLPNYAFITPNMCDDMHDCSVRTGDQWLSKVVPDVLNSPAFIRQNSLLIITWDEGNNANNNVVTIFAGPAAKRSYISNAYFSHYSLLHTIESAWNLKPLTQNDESAPTMRSMMR